MLYNEGSLKNVRLEEEKELGACTAQGYNGENPVPAPEQSKWLALNTACFGITFSVQSRSL